MSPVPLLVGLLLTLAVEPGPSPSAVLRLEDVVRWHVSGVPAAEIVSRIESAAVEFDLDEEMLAELRLAGLPESVLLAMQARQAELHPTASPAVPDTQPAPAASIVLHLRGAKPGETARVDLPARVPPALAATIGLDDANAVVSAAALYVACTRATHVPSHWRADSPLGRDFATMPRHEMLRFEPLGPTATGAAPDERPKAARIVGELAASLDVPLDLAETHDLSVGVAVQIGDRYYRLDSDTWSGLVPGEHPDGLEVVFEPVTPPGIRVRFARGDSSAAPGT